MVDPTRVLVGRDPRWFLGDGVELPPLDGQPVTMGLDLASRPDMHVDFTPADDFDEFRAFLFGDGSGRPIGGLLGATTSYVLPGDAPRLLSTPIHPGHMTRQRRRAAERAARKGRHEPR